MSSTLILCTKYYLKGINMILYLTLILKYWKYIVIALCLIIIVALLIRCNILDERNTSLKKEHELQLNTIVITNQAKTIELIKQQNETEKRISEVIQYNKCIIKQSALVDAVD